MTKFEPQAERLTKQHALRVESHAVVIGHAVRDQLKVGGAGRQERAR